MTMASRDLVGYDYIAAGLGLRHTKAAREYRHRHKDFPKPVNTGQRSPLFRRVDADRYIAAHRTKDAVETQVPAPVQIDLDQVVDFAYFATGLQISVKTAYKYGTPTSGQYIPGFPDPVTPVGVRTRLFNRLEADVFIAGRRAAAANQKGRVRAAAIDSTARAAAQEVARLVDRDVNLENRTQLQELLFTELGLPATSTTSRGPSVATAELQKLYEKNPHPVLRQILIYRGAMADDESSAEVKP
jgi:predicted DNA-binding transcriptional regulator AlpA